MNNPIFPKNLIHHGLPMEDFLAATLATTQPDGKVLNHSNMMVKCTTGRIELKV